MMSEINEKVVICRVKNTGFEETIKVIASINLIGNQRLVAIICVCSVSQDPPPRATTIKPPTRASQSKPRARAINLRSRVHCVRIFAIFPRKALFF